jgi:hypothetical protein
MLPCFQRFDDQFRVCIMAGENGNVLMFGSLMISSSLEVAYWKPNFLRRMLGMESAGGGDAHQFDVTGFFDGGKQHGVGEEAGAQYAQFTGCDDLKVGTEERQPSFLFHLSCGYVSNTRPKTVLSSSP